MRIDWRGIGWVLMLWGMGALVLWAFYIIAIALTEGWSR
jgi:hypothetical protein